PVVLVHPRRFEEAPAVVAIRQWLSRLVQQDDILWCFSEADHVTAEARDLRARRRLILRGIHIFRVVAAGGPSLQLPAPDASKVHVERAVGILEHGRIDAVGAFDGFGLCFEWTRRL